MASTRKKMMKKDTGALGGFTIIEVVLVLAIAGLIFLMVFIALPTLQRSQRDTQRRNDMARVSTALTQYQTNNSGKLPGTGACTPSNSTVGGITGTTDACKFIKNYMNSSTAASTAESEFVDPTGNPYKLTITTTVPTSLSYDDKRVYIVTGARCDGETATKTKSSRDYAILYKLEGSGTYCADNGS